MSELLSKLKQYEDSYEKLVSKLGTPDVSANPEKIKEYGKKISELEDIVNASKKYKEVLSSITEIEGMLKDEKEEEMNRFLNEELKNNKNLRKK